MIAWVDLEATGLDYAYEQILEIGMVITDDVLNIIAQKSMVLGIRDYLRETMDPFVVEMHNHNGLLEESLQATLNEHQVEQEMLDWCSLYLKQGEAPLAGSTIHFDRAFIKQNLPDLEKFFHYRNIDVSTLKQLAQRWNESVYVGRIDNRPERSAHRAIPDILGSIEELKYYRKNFLVVQ